MPHGASDHNVPTAAKTKNAIGSMQAGCFRDRASVGSSSVGASTIIHITAKIATSDVDQGSASAIPTTTRSAVRAQAAGSRQTGSAAPPADVEAPTLMPCSLSCPL